MSRLQAVAGEENFAGATAPQVLGDCSLVRVTGKGGMGVVWEAQQLSLKRRVAVKVLTWEQSLARKSVARFRREAEAGASIDHEGIVAVHAVGEQDGQFYLVQELVENGYNLSEYLGERREDTELGED